MANRTASTPFLLQEVERRAGERPTRFTLLIPGASEKDWTLPQALKELRRAARGSSGFGEARIDGRVGAGDPFEAVKRALEDDAYDDVLISTLPKRRSLWLRRDLKRRVEALGVPVAVITPPAGGPALVLREDGAEHPARRRVRRGLVARHQRFRQRSRCDVLIGRVSDEALRRRVERLADDHPRHAETVC